MPILDANSLEFISRSAEQTRRVGMHLGAQLSVADVICLEGELGSGKTTFVQGMAAGWGTVDAVSSPTFVLVNQYRRTDGEHFSHLDAYRLEDSAAAVALDLDEMLMQGPIVVEWADRIESALPDEHLWVDLSHLDSEQRGLQFHANGDHYQEMLDNFQEAVFGVV